MLGKIEASLDEKLKNVEWGEYELKNLFTKKTIRGVPKSKESLTPVANGYHMFGQNILYQYPQKILLDDKYLQTVDERYPILAYTSSVGEIGIIKESFYRSGDNGAFQGLFPKKRKFTFRELQFILISLKKQFDLFGYATGMANVLELKFQLPTQNGEIYYNFMESFIAELEARHIAELEARHIAELEAYLSVTGLKDYNLSKNEQETLSDYLDGKIELKEYSISELFEVESYQKRFDANKVTVKENGKFPYVVRMSTNNGQKGFIDEDEEFLNEGNTISFGQDTATMFYQEKSYFTGDKIKILKPKHKEFCQKNAHFFITAMSKSFCNFSWGSSSFNVKIIENQRIVLPIKDGQIDFKTIEIIVLAIKKMVIADVVYYSDQKIKATKDVVS